MSSTTEPARRSAGALVLSLVVLVVLGGCSGDIEEVTEPLGGATASAGDQAVVAELRAAGLSTIASAVEQVDFTGEVTDGEFTLFAPDDEAFQSLTADQLADMTSDGDRLLAMLRDHVVDGVVTAEDLAGASELTTVAGTRVEVGTDQEAVTVGEATVVEADRTAGAGVVHVVDALLVRP